MTKKIPKVWQQMKSGEQVHSCRPFHVLQELAAIAKESGIDVRLDPAPNGYWVVINEADGLKVEL